MLVSQSVKLRKMLIEPLCKPKLSLTILRGMEAFIIKSKDDSSILIVNFRLNKKFAGRIHTDESEKRIERMRKKRVSMFGQTLIGFSDEIVKLR